MSGSNVYYLRNTLYNPKLVAEEFGKQVKVPFDVLVGTGVSGITGLMTLRALLGVNIAIVRKEGENSHSPYRVERTDSCENAVGRKWIFVDDLIDSGRTFNRVASLFGKDHCMGAFLYSDGWADATHGINFRTRNDLVLLL